MGWGGRMGVVAERNCEMDRRQVVGCCRGPTTERPRRPPAHLSPRLSAFSTTNLVWLRGPSLASTSSTAPSTMPSTLCGGGWGAEGC